MLEAMPKRLEIHAMHKAHAWYVILLFSSTLLYSHHIVPCPTISYHIASRSDMI
jgi:hypothetical protein